MRRSSLLLAVGSTMVVAALLAAPAYAQGTSRGVTTGAAGWGALDGSVRDESGEWLRDVEVFPLDEPEIHTRSGPGGAFRIDSIPAGVHRIRFRRLGVVALTVTVTVRPGTITTVDAVVDQTSVALGRVTVEARGGELSDLPPAVLGRIHRGAGRYVTAADIRHQAPTSTAEIFRSVPGITVVGAPGREMLLDAHADAQFHIDPDNQGHITYLAPCPDGMAVYIDGAPAGARGALSSLAPKDIAAIEIYENPSEIPATLGASQCGTVYIWTR